MSQIRHLISLLAALLLTQCAREPAPYTVVSTTLSKHAESTEFRKVFSLNHDLRGNGWVMRRGTKIAFGADGSVTLDTIVYALDGLPLPNAIQLESIQYGPDGNVLFAIPGNDVGHSLHMRHARRDYPVSARFGYKKPYFERITTVKFAARLLKEPGLVPAYHTSSKQGAGW